MTDIFNGLIRNDDEEEKREFLASKTAKILSTPNENGWSNDVEWIWDNDLPPADGTEHTPENAEKIYNGASWGEIPSIKYPKKETAAEREAREEEGQRSDPDMLLNAPSIQGATDESELVHGRGGFRSPGYPAYYHLQYSKIMRDFMYKLGKYEMPEPKSKGFERGLSSYKSKWAEFWKNAPDKLKEIQRTARDWSDDETALWGHRLAGQIFHGFTTNLLNSALFSKLPKEVQIAQLGLLELRKNKTKDIDWDGALFGGIADPLNVLGITSFGWFAKPFVQSGMNQMKRTLLGSAYLGGEGAIWGSAYELANQHREIVAGQRKEYDWGTIGKTAGVTSVATAIFGGALVNVRPGWNSAKGFLHRFPVGQRGVLRTGVGPVDPPAGIGHNGGPPIDREALIEGVDVPTTKVSGSPGWKSGVVEMLDDEKMGEKMTGQDAVNFLRNIAKNYAVTQEEMDVLNFDELAKKESVTKQDIRNHIDQNQPLLREKVRSSNLPEGSEYDYEGGWEQHHEFYWDSDNYSDSELTERLNDQIRGGYAQLRRSTGFGSGVNVELQRGYMDNYNQETGDSYGTEILSNVRITPLTAETIINRLNRELGLFEGDWEFEDMAQFALDDLVVFVREQPPIHPDYLYLDADIAQKEAKLKEQPLTSEMTGPQYVEYLNLKKKIDELYAQRTSITEGIKKDLLGDFGADIVNKLPEDKQAEFEELFEKYQSAKADFENTLSGRFQNFDNLGDGDRIYLALDSLDHLNEVGVESYRIADALDGTGEAMEHMVYAEGMYQSSSTNIGEAEDTARLLLQDHMEQYGNMGETKWSNVLHPYASKENYKEITSLFPKESAKGTHLAGDIFRDPAGIRQGTFHFPEQDRIFHIRTSDTHFDISSLGGKGVTPATQNGVKGTFVQELQSDLFQKGTFQKRKPASTTEEKFDELVNEIAGTLGKYRKRAEREVDAGNLQGEYDRAAVLALHALARAFTGSNRVAEIFPLGQPITGFKGLEGKELHTAMAERLIEERQIDPVVQHHPQQKTREKVIERYWENLNQSKEKYLPYKNTWLNLAVKRGIIEAVNDGHTFVAFPSSKETASMVEHQHVRDISAGIAKRYEKQIPDILKKIIKEYGGELKIGHLAGQTGVESRIVGWDFTDALEKIKRTGFRLPAVGFGGYLAAETMGEKEGS